MKDNEPALHTSRGQAHVDADAEKQGEEDIVKHLNDIAYFLGIPVEDWTLVQWKEAAHMAVRGLIALEHQLHRSIVDQFVDRLVPAAEIKRGRGRPPKLTIGSLIPKAMRRSKSRLRMAGEEISEETALSILNIADHFDTDRQAILAMVEDWRKANNYSRYNRNVATFRNSLRVNISRYRKRFARPRPTS